jgi:hypothetical protein
MNVQPRLKIVSNIKFRRTVSTKIFTGQKK